MQDPAISHLVGVLLADQQTRHSGGIERFLARLSTQQGRESWEAWKANPVTQVVIDALKSLSETGIGGIEQTPIGLALRHGVLCGMGMAVRLCEDPTRVFPSIFDGEKNLAGRQPAPDHVPEDYTTPPQGEEGLTTDGY